MENEYFPPMIEILEVNVEQGYAGSQLPDRNPVYWWSFFNNPDYEDI